MVLQSFMRDQANEQLADNVSFGVLNKDLTDEYLDSKISQMNKSMRYMNDI